MKRGAYYRNCLAMYSPLSIDIWGGSAATLDTQFVKFKVIQKRINIIQTAMHDRALN